MTSSVRRIALTEVIDQLYAEARLPMPTPERPIAPVAEMVNTYSVSSVDLDDLTVTSAVQFLLSQGGAIDVPDGMPDEPLAGFLYATTQYGCIFVERADPISRRRFSAAHELGHYLCHFRPIIDQLAADGRPIIEGAPRLTQDDAEPVERMVAPPILQVEALLGLGLEALEREANQFAAEILMPDRVVRALAREYQPFLGEEDIVWRLASEMLVSRSTMRWRLRNLGLATGPSVRLN